MQRVLSLFPAGRAGVGLLCLRGTVACGIALVSIEPAHTVSHVLFLCESLMIFLLLVGFMARIVAGLGCLLAALLAFAGGRIPSLCEALTFLAGASLMLGGPGAFSVDALLFGRRRVTFDVHDDSQIT